MFSSVNGHQVSQTSDIKFELSIVLLPYFPSSPSFFSFFLPSFLLFLFLIWGFQTIFLPFFYVSELFSLAYIALFSHECFTRLVHTHLSSLRASYRCEELLPPGFENTGHTEIHYISPLRELSEIIRYHMESFLCCISWIRNPFPRWFMWGYVYMKSQGARTVFISRMRIENLFTKADPVKNMYTVKLLNRLLLPLQCNSHETWHKLPAEK